MASIKTTMVKGESRDYPFTITNVGKGETGKISLALPSWISSVTPMEMPSLAKDESTEIILRMTPTDKMQLNVPVTGNIAINCANGEGMPLPFCIEPVSTKEGKLTIDVCDENTYYTKEAPHLAGAKVEITHPTTGAVVADGITNEKGLFSADLTEGYYAVRVSAEKHDSYRNNLLVDPGTETKKVVNLSYEAINIDWKVEETEIQDEYEIKTNVKFETQVPMPVVVLSIPSSIPAKDLRDGESLIFNAVLTNKGLIAAKDVELTLPTDLKTLTFEALDHTEAFNLAPQESVIIPVKVTKSTITASARAAKPQGHIDNDPCSDQVGTLYYWDCGLDRKWHKYGIALQLGSCKSNDPSTWSGNGDGTGYGGGIGGGLGSLYGPGARPSIGGSGTYTGSSNQNPLVQVEDKGCEPCQNGVLIAGLKCAGHFVGEAVETLQTLLGLDDNIDTNNKDKDKKDKDLDEILDKCENYSDLLLDIASSFDGCVNGKHDIDQVLDCYETASKAIDAVFDGLVETAFGPYVKPELIKKYKKLGKQILKYKKLLDRVAECARDFAHACDHIKNDESAKARMTGKSTKTVTEKAIEGMGKYAEYVEGFVTLNNVLFGSEPAWDEMSLEEMSGILNLDYHTISFEEALKYKPKDVSETLFRKFFDKQKKWANKDYSNITEEESGNITTAVSNIHNAFKYFEDEGYLNPCDFLNTTFKDALILANTSSSSVCSSITLQFTQKMVMTRQAFRGTLTVFNGNEQEAMKDVKLTLTVTDEKGNIAMSDKFQVNPEKLEGFNGKLDFTDGWTLDAQKEGVATVLFIPTKKAAPTVETRYAFGGTLSYVDPFTGLEVTRDLTPITLTVKPSPNLDLTYFMQRDIKGDDPLTKEVEPSEEAEFSLLINNLGYGDATNVKMTTNQPEIVDNEKGLKVKFELMSSQLNGQEKTLALGGSVFTDFGNIPAHSTSYAQWWIKSSLLGHFTDYDVTATHLTSYDNKDLSLLNDVTIHELIRSIDVTKGDKTLKGFMTNDIVDADDTPDMLYLSDGEIEKVNVAASSSITKTSDTEYTLTITPSEEGWNYGNLSDPTYGVSALKSVTRASDGKQISLRNFWQTDRTLRDGKDPLYENRIHFADQFDGKNAESYILTFEATPSLMLEVASIEGAPAEDEVATQPVNTLKVMFNKYIDPATFTSEDIQINVQGKEQDSQLVKISTEDNKNFVLDLTQLNASAGNGYYTLTVQTSGITDSEGFAGKTGKTASWTLFVNSQVKLLTSKGCIAWKMEP